MKIESETIEVENSKVYVSKNGVIITSDRIKIESN